MPPPIHDQMTSDSSATIEVTASRRAQVLVSARFIRPSYGTGARLEVRGIFKR